MLFTTVVAGLLVMFSVLALIIKYLLRKTEDQRSTSTVNRPHDDDNGDDCKDEMKS